MVTAKHRLLLAALLLFTAAACSSGSPDPAGVMPAIPPGMAQLIVKRTTGVLNITVRAYIEVNGERSEFGREDGRSRFVPAGRTVVSVLGTSPPGRYTISFDAQPAQSYLVEASVRR